MRFLWLVHVAVCVLPSWRSVVSPHCCWKPERVVEERLVEGAQLPSVSVAWVELARAIPPRRAGRARRFFSQSFGGGLCVREGMSLVLIVCSIGIGQEEMPCKVRDR